MVSSRSCDINAPADSASPAKFPPSRAPFSSVVRRGTWQIVDDDQRKRARLEKTRKMAKAEAKKKGEHKKLAHSKKKKKKKEDSDVDEGDEDDDEGDDDSSAAEVRLSVAEAPVCRTGAFPAPI